MPIALRRGWRPAGRRRSCELSIQPAPSLAYAAGEWGHRGASALLNVGVGPRGRMVELHRVGLHLLAGASRQAQPYRQGQYRHQHDDRVFHPCSLSRSEFARSSVAGALPGRRCNRVSRRSEALAMLHAAATGPPARPFLSQPPQSAGLVINSILQAVECALADPATGSVGRRFQAAYPRVRHTIRGPGNSVTQKRDRLPRVAARRCGSGGGMVGALIPIGGAFGGGWP